MSHAVVFVVHVRTGDVPPLLTDQARAVYPVIGIPPVLVGIDHAVPILFDEPVALTANGAVGADAGVTVTRGVDAGPVPLALLAVTST
jgi:hypothetical protein